MSSPEYEQLVRFLGPRFDTIDRRFETIDRRFETIDRRFDSVDRKFDELRAELLQRLRSSS
jgi:chaperonin cofactor prefoldin